MTMNDPDSEKTPWSTDRIRALGAVTDVETAGKILGIGRTLAYQLAKENRFPVRVVRVGNLYRIPTLEVLKLLGET